MKYWELRFARVLVLVLSATGAFASTFELTGTVLDESGVELAGATLTLVHEGTGLVHTTTSNDSGRYAFPAMPPGEYSLVVRLSGFATSRFAGLRYFAETKPIFNVTLNLRAVQESMTFTGEAPLINVSQSQLGLSVEERQLHELPLTRRDYLELATVEGGVHEINETVPGAVVYGARLTTVNGANAHYTSYHLDGFGNTRDQHGVVHVDVDLSAIEEFRVISGQFSAEYGQSLTGIVSATTRSGTNDFHGSIFAYLRPGSWDASDPLTGTDTALNGQELGFTFSGAIGEGGEDNTQFFTSFSYQNQDDDVVVTAPYGDGRFGGLFELPSSRHRFLVKLTHLFDSRHQLAVKAAFSERNSLESVGGYDIFDNRLETLNEDASVYATFVSELGSGSSELRFGFARERFRTRGQKPPLGAVEIHPTLGNIGNPMRFQRADEDHFEVSETLTLPTGDHRLKIGFNFLRIGSTTELERYRDGVLFVPPTGVHGPLLLWRNFTGADAETVLERSESHVQVFFQDDWQVTPFFTVNLGLRWEKETSVPDNNNIAPRLGFHWDATRDGRTSVRGGYGIFYSFVFSIVDSLERLYGVGGHEVVAFTDDNIDEVFFNPALLSPNFYVDAVEWARADRQAPSSRHVTIGVERELVPTVTAAVDVSYVRGKSLILPVDLNAPEFFDYTTGDIRSGNAADRARPFGVPGAPIARGMVPELPDGYPFGGYRDLYLLSSAGSSRFWSVKVNVTKRYATDFLIQAVYNWSRTENDGDNFRVSESLALDPARPELEWGRSTTDIPHSFVINGVWDAPLGLRLTGLFRARSGRPVDPRVDADLDGDRKLRERASSPGAILERNSFRIGSVASLDLSIAKEWEFGEGRRVAAALDVFNLTNRLNPKQYLQSYGARSDQPLPAFLQIVQASPPRQFQLSVRFTF